jgi:hypothetical protein
MELIYVHLISKCLKFNTLKVHTNFASELDFQRSFHKSSFQKKMFAKIVQRLVFLASTWFLC